MQMSRESTPPPHPRACPWWLCLIPKQCSHFELRAPCRWAAGTLISLPALPSSPSTCPGDPRDSPVALSCPGCHQSRQLGAQRFSFLVLLEGAKWGQTGTKYFLLTVVFTELLYIVDENRFWTVNLITLMMGEGEAAPAHSLGVSLAVSSPAGFDSHYQGLVIR